MSELIKHLIQAALRDIHTSWLPDMDASLLTKAKASDFGQRWLVSQLAALELFSAPPSALQISSDLLQANAWWRASFSENCDLLIGLGAYRSIPVIRRAILRDQVLQWRRVLGYSLYQHLLHEPIERNAKNEQPDATIEPTLDWHDDASLVQMLRKQAYGELMGFATHQHLLLAQRVALAFPQSWWQAWQNDPPTPMLAPTTLVEIVTRCGEN